MAHRPCASAALPVLKAAQEICAEHLLVLEAVQGGQAGWLRKRQHHAQVWARKRMRHTAVWIYRYARSISMPLERYDAAITPAQFHHTRTVNGLLKTWCLAPDRAGFEHAAGAGFIEGARPQLFECALSGHWPERTSFAAASMKPAPAGNHGAAGIVRASAASGARHHVC